MKKIEDAKNKYNNIEIPKELNNMTNALIKLNKPKNNFRYFYTTAAGLVLFILIGVNVSETFATSFSKIPIIGKIVSVVSIYGKKIDNDKVVNTEVPKISSEDENVKNTADKLNKQIQNIVDNYTKEAEQHIAEYKEAFIATGGTEEEFQQKNIVVDVSYDVKSESKDHLSLVLSANENWVNAYNVSYFYNINLNTGENITLKDLLGDDYINIANESIKNQIEERMAKDENVIKGFNKNVESKKIRGVSTSEAISLEEFKDLLLLSNIITKEIGNDIVTGNIKVHPYKHKEETGCENCNYTDICNFEILNKKQKYNNFRELPKEEVWRKIKEKIQKEKIDKE